MERGREWSRGEKEPDQNLEAVWEKSDNPSNSCSDRSSEFASLLGEEAKTSWGPDEL